MYQFNLLTVFDARLVRMMFDGPNIKCEPIDAEQYLARYIIKRKDTFARIRFIKANAFPAALDDYARLHAANCQWAGSECDAFLQGRSHRPQADQGLRRRICPLVDCNV